MTRRARPPQAEAGPLAAFARDLRGLQDRAGDGAPTVAQISSDAGIPRSTLYAALKGDRLSGREVVTALARSWRGDVAEWLAKRTTVEAELTSYRKTTEPSVVSSREHRLRTLQTERSVVVVVGNVASFDRLRSTVSCIEADHRIQLIFAVRERSVFAQSLREALGQLGISIASWPEVSYRHFDLILTTSVLPSTEKDHTRPVLLIPSVGFEKYIAQEPPDDSYHVILADESARDRLQESAPSLAERALVLGDPSFDQLVVSQPQRVSYRHALGVGRTQKLILVASTWGPASLLAEHFDLVQRLLAVLPPDKFQVCLVLHPNTWAWHGQFQVQAWLQDALHQGLLLIPPLGGEQAALVAADVVIGDHGSATSYAAALGHPVLQVPSQAPTDSATADLNAGRYATSQQLNPDGDLRRQVETAIKRSAAGSTVAAANVRTPDAAAKSGKELRSMLYQILKLDMPAAQWQPEPVPAPTPLQPERMAQTVPTHTRALDHLAHELTLEIQENPTPSTQQLPAVGGVLHSSFTDEFTAYRNTAAVNPEEAILGAWIRIENLMRLAIREVTHPDQKPSAVTMTDQLLNIGLGPQLVRVADGLRRIRNVVAHVGGNQISPTGALDYIDAAERLARSVTVP